MKIFQIPSKFYILFVFFLLAPAVWLSNVILNFVVYLSQKYSYIDNLFNLGALEVLTPLILLLVFIYIFNRWLWKIFPFNQIFRIPVVSGRYLGKLKSSFNQDNIYDIVVEIEQSLTNINVCLYTERSQSFSLACVLFKNEFGVWSIYYIYRNKTRAMGSDADMNSHDGTVVINIIGKKLEGYYYNDLRDRGKFGTFAVEFENKKLLKLFK
jgi:hypothetical protein